MSSTTDLRVEDLICAGFTLTLAAVLAARAQLDVFLLDESNWWDLAMIVFPLACTLFVLAVRFAFRDLSGAPAGGLGAMGRTVRDWLPFLFFAFAYEAFRTRVWVGVSAHDFDAELLSIDRRLFGETPALSLERFVSPGLTTVMGWLYFSHLLLPPFLAFLLYFRSRARFREFLLAFLLCGTLGAVGYVLVPATGPRVAYASLFAVPLGDEPFSAFLEVARAPRDAFPSLHAAVSALVLWYAAREVRAWRLVALPLVAGIWVSTIYLRYHYAIDLVAGGLLAAVVIAAAHALLALERRFREAPSAGGPGASRD